MNVNSISTFFATGAVLIAAGLVAVAGIRILAFVSEPGRRIYGRIQAAVKGYGLWLAWLMASIATLGSLYYSEIANFIPCEYCWYQRIAMYPLAIILGIAAFKGDALVRRYVYPLAAIGSVVSLYHYLIQQFPDLATGVCSTMTPCTAALVWKYDFVSIPFMALVSFLTIIAMLVLDRTGTARQTDHHADDRPQGAA